VNSFCCRLIRTTRFRRCCRRVVLGYLAQSFLELAGGFQLIALPTNL
jgi:hypothetical protein